MMQAMGPDHAAYVPKSEQSTDGKTPVNQSVVHDDVRDAEHGHPNAGSVQNLAPHAGRSDAPVQDERDSERRMQHRERIVGFEAPSARLVMRAVDGPEPSVPNLAMKQRCPSVHGHRDDD